MKILVTGVNGQLGYDVVRCLKTNKKFEIIGTDIADTTSCECKYIPLDLTNSENVRSVIKKEMPNAIVHCAGWTSVDAAEDNNNKDIVMAINADATLTIARACKEIGSKMMFISTDYVFDGCGDSPFKADDTNKSPLNVYGLSKMIGENNVSNTLNNYFILRISWAFGINGNNFVKTILNLCNNNKEIHVVCDQIGTPTYTYDLAHLIIDMIQTEEYGCYNATNGGGFVSWYDFANEIIKLARKHTKIVPVLTKDWAYSKAKRPLNSRLDKSKLAEKGFDLLPDWKDALERYLKELGYINE